MDTRDPKANASKAADELGRHQRVLDAYLAHSGSDPMPPPALDAKLLALAARAVNSTNTVPVGVETNFASGDANGFRSIKTNARARRRRWPFALAASVATIGFVAILARTNFQDTEGYGEPIYQASKYEVPGAAADQAPAAAPLQEATLDSSREQSAAASMPGSADKAKMSQKRTIEQAIGRISAAPESPAPEPVDPETTDAAVARPIVPAAASAPASMPAEESDLAVSKLGTPSADLQAADTRSRRSSMDAAPAVNLAAENAVVETAEAPVPMSKTIEQLAAAEEEKAASTASNKVQASQAPQATMRSEPAQSGASAPLDDATKKDEFAPDAQSDAANPHAKTYTAIRVLRDSGEVMKAGAMLARFQKAYPQVQLPEDLAALAKAN